MLKYIHLCEERLKDSCSYKEKSDEVICNFETQNKQIASLKRSQRRIELKVYRLKKILIAIIIVLTGILVFRAFSNDRVEYAILQENSMLIQREIFNVSKLIVTEGHYAEVYNYKDSQELFGSLVTADKKALVVVNADVTVAYDMNKIDFELDEEERTLYIKSIPEPEIKISPDFEYYDVSADYLNPFDASDYNKIKENVNASLMKKMETSTLKSNAKNRLISELQKIFVLTNSMDWTLVYEDSKVDKMEDLRLTD